MSLDYENMLLMFYTLLTYWEKIKIITLNLSRGINTINYKTT